MNQVKDAYDIGPTSEANGPPLKVSPTRAYLGPEGPNYEAGCSQG